MSTLNPRQSFFLMDDMANPRTGWDRDFRGAEHYPVKEWNMHVYVKSVNTKYPCMAKREITRQTEGKITFEANFQQYSGDGVYLGFYDGNIEALRIDFRGGYACASGKKLFTSDYTIHHLKFILDIDAGKVSIYLDGKYAAETSFTGIAKAISNVRIGYEVEDLGYADIHCCKMYKNYLVNDFVIAAYNGDLPQEYEISKLGKSKVYRRQYGNLKYNYVYSIEATKGSHTTITRKFDRTGEKLSLELKYIITKKNGEAKISLIGEGKNVITLSDTGTGLCHDGTLLKKHSAYTVWQTLRVDADPVSKSVLIYLNGKKITYLPYDNLASFIDGFKVEFSAGITASEFMMGEIISSIILPEPADYVPEPVIPKKKGEYYVGMNVCSLWRDGQHHGWDCITPFEDHKPLIGFYDEGIPEVADWEIKFMAEHGVDFQLYCWYPEQDKLPIMCPRLNYQWNTAHMYAKYSDKVKFALLFEASGTNADSFESFKKYYVPYWIDYYFSDDRYMSIDGYAVMSIYGIRNFVAKAGSLEEAKKRLDYLRSEVKKIGYKGLIILTCGDPDKTTQALGIDGSHAYNWGHDGYDLEYTKSRNISNINSGFGHQVPTVSSGFNVVAWRVHRSPNMTPDDMEKALAWVRDDVLTGFDKNSWKSKLCILSTWNEYGEGTYISPSTLHGFGYLDAVRNVFCEEMPHTDIIPTEKQQESFCLLHPKDRNLLAALHYIPCDEAGEGSYKHFEFKTKEDLDKWEFHGFTDYEIKDGVLIGHSNSDYPYMLLKETVTKPIPASKVFDVRAVHRSYKQNEQMCSMTLGFNTEPNPASRRYLIGKVSNPKERVEFNFDIRARKSVPFDGNLYNFIVRPVWAEGYFEIESIDFIASARTKEFYIDGELVNLSYDFVTKNGVIYLPFDPGGKASQQKWIYFIWNKELKQLTINSDDSYTFTVGSDKVICNNEVILLPEPLELYDGIPLIPLELYARISGKKLTVNGNIISLD